MERTFIEEKFVICHNGSDIIHYSRVPSGSTMTSGQPNYEEFDSEEEWQTRLKELGVALESENKGREFQVPLSIKESEDVNRRRKKT
jgi:hypothetical protein